MTKVLEKLSKEDAIKDLYSDACRWVDTSFNYIDVSVYEKMSNDCLYEHIVQSDLSDYANNFSDYITEDECKDWITDFLGNWDSDNSSVFHDVGIDENKLYLDFYKKVDGQYSLDVMKEVYGDAILIDLKSWLLENKEDEIREFAQDDENYPMWSTLFEFKSSFDNTQSNIEKAQEVGLGVIEGLEPFNTTLFAMSCGHSFYASYWIPLYLSIFHPEDNGADKYGYSFESKDYDHL